MWLTFLDLDGLINVYKLSRRYFYKSQSWFAQKLQGNEVCKKERSFNAEEYAQLSQAFRDIARRLNEYADALDSAEEL